MVSGCDVYLLYKILPFAWWRYFAVGISECSFSTPSGWPACAEAILIPLRGFDRLPFAASDAVFAACRMFTANSIWQLRCTNAKNEVWKLVDESLISTSIKISLTNIYAIFVSMQVVLHVNRSYKWRLHFTDAVEGWIFIIAHSHVITSYTWMGYCTIYQFIVLSFCNCLLFYCIWDRWNVSTCFHWISWSNWSSIVYHIDGAHFLSRSVSERA